MNAFALIVIAAVVLQAASTTVQVVVTADGRPVGGAQIVANGTTVRTGSDGRAIVNVMAGPVEMTVIREGFTPQTVAMTATAGETQIVSVALEPQTAIEEHVTVSATRTDKRIEDQPMRVEVLDAEEIEEKQLMTPGDIVMMLNEMGGLRVQATSPSLGAATVRVQGMRGHYTRFLSDGLPLFGADVGGLGLLQIPPTDLGRVEVIKGVASALYGAGALGGVVDLISRRPASESSGEVLVNRTTLGGTDAVLFASQPLGKQWSGTWLLGGHWQERNDVDGDGWADLAGYSRGVVRPRLFWNGTAGQSIFFTAGALWERRRGGTMPGTTLSTTGAPFVESLETQRFDAGVVAQTPVAQRYILTARVSVTHKTGAHVLGDLREDDAQSTVFSEVALRGTAPRQTWVGGLAFERSTLDARDQPAFNYAYGVPGVFAQDDIDVRRWLAVSMSARLDAHDQFGAFLSPRVSALLRGGSWSSRISIGSGFFAATALTDETEAAGLARLQVPTPLKAERGRSVSADVTRTVGSFTITGTVFRYDIDHPAVLNRATYTLTTLDEPTIDTGVEAVATWRRASFSATGTYTYVRSLEGVGAERGEIPLTPRHSAGLVGMWERENRGRIGLEAYFTGRQRLEDNPFRSESASYVLFGGLIERRVWRVRLFINVENLANVRQTQWDPLTRPSRAADGRWTVDAWAPLDGRVVNGGVRVSF
jgi:outer membrane receptor for ferrienterochelin and colicins